MAKTVDFREKIDQLPFVEALEAKISLKKELSSALSSKVSDLRDLINQQIEKARGSNPTFNSICTGITEGKGVFGFGAGGVSGKFLPVGIGNFRTQDGRPCGAVAVQLIVRELKGTTRQHEIGRFYLFSSVDNWIFFAGEGETLDIGNPLSMEEGVDFVLKEIFVRTDRVV